MSFRLRGLILFEHKGIESTKIGSALPKDMKKNTFRSESILEFGLGIADCFFNSEFQEPKLIEPISKRWIRVWGFALCATTPQAGFKGCELRVTGI